MRFPYNHTVDAVSAGMGISAWHSAAGALTQKCCQTAMRTVCLHPKDTQTPANLTRMAVQWSLDKSTKFVL